MISFVILSAMMRSRSPSVSPARNAAESAMDMSQTSEMFLSFTFTASEDGLRRAPSQSEQGTSRM